MKNLSHYIQTYPDRSRSLLGIEYERLTALIASLQQVEAKAKAQQNARKIRVNALGASRLVSLSQETEILLCLYYLRHYPRFEILGLTFEVSTSQAHALMQDWVSLIRQILPSSLYEELGNSETAWSVVSEMLTE